MPSAVTLDIVAPAVELGETALRRRRTKPDGLERIVVAGLAVLAFRHRMVE